MNRVVRFRSPRHGVRLRCDRLEDRTVPTSFQGLGFLPGWSSSVAYDVSADGLTVVGATSFNSPRRAFRWTQAGGMADLGTLTGDTGAIARSVSRDGSIVVGNSENGGPDRSFRWIAGSGMAEMDGGMGNITSAVSGDGMTIVGTSSSHAYRWTASTGRIDLGVLPGAFTSAARGVSENGSVVAGFSTFTGPHNRAFLWSLSSGMMIDLGALPLSGLTDVVATDVSADGSAVVGFCQSPNAFRAFRWTAATGMVDLGVAAGSSDIQAWGVSADGSVVVGEALGSNYRAVYWTPSSGLRDLQSDLVSIYGLGTQLTGWNLIYAYSCSADGNVIAGYGTDPGGNIEAWIARLDGPPSVRSTQVNGGFAQRSRVTDLKVTFNAPVSFATTPGAAFRLTRNSDGASVGFTASSSVEYGLTVVTLNNFTGPATQFSSLADGRYTLTALASQISAGGQQMTSDYTFGDNQGLFRFFGDINGDRHVDVADFGLFSTSYGLHAGQTGFISTFDFNNDGVIDIVDFGQFAIRMFTVLP